MLKMAIEVKRGWVAVDGDGSVWWYACKPKWDKQLRAWMISGSTAAEPICDRTKLAVDAKASLMRVNKGKINVFVTQGEGE